MARPADLRNPAAAAVLRAALAVPLVLAAWIVRTRLLDGSGHGIPYLTFYPAVMFAALFGGLPAGVLATLLSALVTVFWIHAGRMSIPQSAALGLFSLSSLWIVWLIESRRKSALLAERTLADLRQALDRQRETEARYRSYVDCAPDAVFVADERGRFVDVNPAACAMTGYSREELLGLSNADLRHPGDAAAAAETYARLLVDGHSSGDFRFLHKDGTTRWWHVAGTLISPTLCLGFAQDITGSMLAELEARRSNALLLASQALARVGGWEIDLPSRAVFWTEEVYRIIETSPAEYRPELDTVLLFYAPASIPLIQEAIRRAMEEGEPFDLELELITARGRRIWVHVTGHALREQGRLARVLGAFQDITERKRAEAALVDRERDYRRLIQGMPVGVLLQGPQAEILLGNPRAMDLLGVTEEGLLGRTSFDPAWRILHEDGSPFPGQSLPVPRAIATRRPVRNVLMGVERPAPGGLVWLSVDAVPELDGEGQVERVVCTFVDVTERQLAEQEVRKHRATLEAALNSIQDAVFIADAEGGLMDFNDAFVSFHKFRNRADCARTLADFSRLLEITQASGERVPVDQWVVPRALRGEKATNVESCIRRTDTGESWVGSFSFGPIRDSAGRIHGAVVVGRDITEWKRLAEQRHRTIFEHATMGIAWSSPEGLFQEVNPAWNQMLGYGPGELIGVPARTLIHPDELGSSAALRASMVEGAQDEIHQETRWLRKDGRTIWVDLTVRPVRDGAGKVEFHFAMAEDISEKRRVREDLERLLREQEILLANVNVGICLVVDRQQVWINKWMEDTFQYSRAELEGCPTRYLYRRQRDYEALGREAYPALARGESYEAEREMVRRDGQSRWIHFHGKAIDPADLGQGTLWVLTDVTAARQAEEALRASELKYSTLFRILPTGVVLVDDQGRVVDANPASERILGLTRAQQLERSNVDPGLEILRPDGSLCPPEEYVTVRALRTGLAVENVELGMRHPDGSIGWNLVSATPIPVKGLGVAWVGMDITARRKAEAALAELNRVLEDRIQAAVTDLRRKDQMLLTQSRMAAMGEMIGNIAHQWRQPLNALSMLLINLGDARESGELTGEKLARDLATADLLIQDMSSTINDFRNFFRQDKAVAAFSALERVRHAVALVEASFHAGSITIRIEASEDVRLIGFPNEYSQVLTNLLSNSKHAIQASRREPGLVIMRLAREEGMGTLTVTDNGGGVDEAFLDRIFDPYFSTDASGTGIGLYMSKLIIEQNMGGRITARNVEGGAEFSVQVPLAP